MAMQRPPSVMAQQRKLGRRGEPNALVAAASLMQAKGSAPSAAKITTETWQNEAWTFYDEVGEFQFGVEWLANALSRVNLVASIPPQAGGEEPTAIDLDATGSASPSAVQRRAVELVADIAGGVDGQGQILAGVTRHLTVPGVGYVVARAGVNDTYEAWDAVASDQLRKASAAGGVEVIEMQSKETGQWEALSADSLVMKVWRPHPRWAHMPHSPARGALGPLRQISKISRRIDADSDSRLVGNGLLVLPMSIEFPAGQGQEDGGDDGDSFVQTLYQVAAIAPNEPSSPAATLPLAIRVPDDAVSKVQHIKFYSEYDAQLEPLRLAAIRRLATAMDMPAEVLIGMGDMNHWGAWQIAEEAITMHVEPLAETICNAFTRFYLHAALADEQYTPEQVATVVIWYDTSDLTTRPDLTAAASEAHARIQISNDAYLTQIGLDPSMAPDDAEKRERILLHVADGAPTLAPQMLAAAGILDPEVAQAATDATDAAASPAGGNGEPPAAETQPPDRPVPEQQSASVLLAASDGLMVRAMEKAGARLRSAAGRKQTGGAAAIVCEDPATLHCAVPATEFASLDALLDGAWDRVPIIAQRCGIGAESLHAALDSYARGLLAARVEHTYDRLAQALGVTDDRRRVAAR